MGALPGQGQQNDSCSPAFLPRWVEGVVDVPVQQIHSEKCLGLEKSCFLAEPFFHPDHSVVWFWDWSYHKRGIDGGWEWQCSTAANSLTNV